MPSFDEIQALLDKVPVYRCPSCNENKRDQFMIFFNVPCEVPVHTIDQVSKRLLASWVSMHEDRDDMTDIRMWCATCQKINPLPEGWWLDIQ